MEQNELKERAYNLSGWIDSEYKEYMVEHGTFGRLSMRVYFRGYIQIVHNNDVVWQGVQSVSAIEQWDEYCIKNNI